jgi:hypothetical protein
METAFLIMWYKSSGMEGASPDQRENEDELKLIIDQNEKTAQPENEVASIVCSVDDAAHG